MQEFQGKVLRGKRTSFGGNSFFKIVVLGGLSKSVEEMNWLIVYSQLTFCSVCKFSCRNSIYIKCRKYLKPFSDKFIFILVKINPTLNLRSLLLLVSFLIDDLWKPSFCILYFTCIIVVCIWVYSILPLSGTLKGP